MGLFQGQGQLANRAGDLPFAQPTLALHDFGQRLAVDERHDNVVATIVRADLMHGADVGVMQSSGGTRLPQKTPSLFVGRQAAGARHLDGHFRSNCGSRAR